MQGDGQSKAEVEVEIQAMAAPSAETEKTTDEIPSQDQQGDKKSKGNHDDEQCPEEVKDTVEEADNENPDQTADSIKNKETIFQEEQGSPHENPDKENLSKMSPNSEDIIAKFSDLSDQALIENENQGSDNNDKLENGIESVSEVIDTSKQEADLVKDVEKESHKNDIEIEEEECEKHTSEHEMTEGKDACDKQEKSDEVESTVDPKPEGDRDCHDTAIEAKITEEQEIPGVDHDLCDGEHQKGHDKVPDLHETTEEADDVTDEETNKSQKALKDDAGQDKVKNEQTLDPETQEGGCHADETAQELDTAAGNITTPCKEEEGDTKLQKNDHYEQGPEKDSKTQEQPKDQEQPEDHEQTDDQQDHADIKNEDDTLEVDTNLTHVHQAVELPIQEDLEDIMETGGTQDDVQGPIL